MNVLSPRARHVLTAGRLAHLVTINADDSPQVTIVWGLQPGPAPPASSCRRGGAADPRRPPSRRVGGLGVGNAAAM
jgi:hypothetical protein